MLYCRQLKFEEEPDYKHVIGLFEKCMQRHEYSTKTFDYTWKQNRLNRDKEALKKSVLGVIKKEEQKKKEDSKIQAAGSGIVSGQAKQIPSGIDLAAQKPTNAPV